MNTETVSYIAVGLLLIVLGLLTWKKQKVTLLHGYHYRNVKQEDIPAYTRSVGIGQMAVGIGFALTGLLRLFTGSKLTWAALIAGLITGLVIMHKAQMKYNGAWFS
jgi:hypothetical protein